MKRIIITVCAIAVALCSKAAVTLDYCLERAEANYPLIKKYALVEKTADLQLSDINRSWLPRAGVYGQLTAQNSVPGFPESLQGILSQMGQPAEGLGKVQYKLGMDVSQTIWDGGASKSQRRIERASAKESESALDVQVYAIREKVIALYFGILLMDEQIEQSNATLGLLRSNCDLMQSMLEGGVAMQSDVDMVEAQMLTVAQRISEARSTVRGYRDMLAIFMGESIDGQELEKPDAAMPPVMESARPELAMFDARTRLNDARNAAVSSTVMPKVGLFAQAWYGYPGFNYFESMIDRNLSFNIIAGVKVQWDIDAFYTRKNSRRKFALAKRMIESDREVFLFNSGLKTSSQIAAISGLRDVMADDGRIVALRGSVRKAAESQLRNGIIDANALLSKITDENQARLTASYHEIQLLKNIYELKNTINR